MSNINIVVAAQVQDAVSGLNQVNQATKRVGDQVDKATKRLKSHTNQYNRSAVATNKWAKGALQQAGYQVGDFAVQVANGTSGIQAFGQQGSQLLGVFGPIGAVLGAGVAIFSAVALAAEKTSNSTTKLTFDFKKLGQDIGPALEPMKKVFQSVGFIFGLMKDAMIFGINALINGFQYFATIVGTIIKRVVDRLELAKMRLQATFKMAQGFMQDIRDAATMSAAPLEDGIDAYISEFGVATTKAEKFRLEAAELNAEIQDLTNSLQDQGNIFVAVGKSIDSLKMIDIRDYFKRVRKEGEQTAASVGDKVETVADMIGEKFGDAFMSMVDGTMKAKDAFRAMASDIIKELYRVFVIKRITGFISGAVSKAFPTFGNTPIGGGGKAIGGPVQAGQSYLVGERGPEMFVPSRSGSIVPNGKMAGGGNVIVNQTINVSTGVQQTVRTEIKSLMPQIAESAKAAVADAKRRGGSYGRAFA